jgi:hypothetical protein
MNAALGNRQSAIVSIVSAEPYAICRLPIAQCRD